MFQWLHCDLIAFKLPNICNEKNSSHLAIWDDDIRVRFNLHNRFFGVVCVEPTLCFGRRIQLTRFDIWIIVYLDEFMNKFTNEIDDDLKSPRYFRYVLFHLSSVSLILNIIAIQ